MGFFEHHLSALGRGIDAVIARCAEGASRLKRSLSDRGRHAESFDAIRRRAERVSDAARTGLERSLDATRDGLRRHPIEPDQARRLAVWVGVVTVIVVAGVGVRWWSSPKQPGIREAEIAAIRRVQGGAAGTPPSSTPGLEAWTRQPGP